MVKHNKTFIRFSNRDHSLRNNILNDLQELLEAHRYRGGNLKLPLVIENKSAILEDLLVIAKEHKGSVVDIVLLNKVSNTIERVLETIYPAEDDDIVDNESKMQDESQSRSEKEQNQFEELNVENETIDGDSDDGDDDDVIYDNKFQQGDLLSALQSAKFNDVEKNNTPEQINSKTINFNKFNSQESPKAESVHGRSIDELLPDANDIYANINGLLNIDMTKVTSPDAIMMKQLYETQLMTIRVVKGDTLKQVNKDRLNKAILRLKDLAASHPAVLTYYQKSAEDVDLKNRINEELTNIRQNYEEVLQKWLKEQSIILEQRYRAEVPDETEIHVANYLESVKPELDAAEENILVAKSTARQALISELTKLTDYPEIAPILEFISIKEQMEKQLDIYLDQLSIIEPRGNIQNVSYSEPQKQVQSEPVINTELEIEPGLESDLESTTVDEEFGTMENELISEPEADELQQILNEITVDDEEFDTIENEITPEPELEIEPEVKTVDIDTLMDEAARRAVNGEDIVIKVAQIEKPEKTDIRNITKESIADADENAIGAKRDTPISFDGSELINLDDDLDDDLDDEDIEEDEDFADETPRKSTDASKSIKKVKIIGLTSIIAAGLGVGGYLTYNTLTTSSTPTTTQSTQPETVISEYKGLQVGQEVKIKTDGSNEEITTEIQRFRKVGDTTVAIVTPKNGDKTKQYQISQTELDILVADMSNNK